MMRFEFRDLEFDDELAKYADLGIWSRIGFLDEFVSVTVCFTLEAGRDGAQTRCRMEAGPLPRANVAVNVVAEGVDADPYKAADRAAERLATIINRLIEARLIQQGAA